MSTGVEAMKMPESPPMTNIETNASALSIGTVNWIRAPQSVPSQLKVLMADGTAMIIVVTVKAIPSAGLMPLTNMRSEEHTSELQSRGHLVCRLLLEKKKKIQ